MTNLRAELVLTGALQCLSPIYAFSSRKDLMHVFFFLVLFRDDKRLFLRFEQEVEIPIFGKEVARHSEGSNIAGGKKKGKLLKRIPTDI